jgi:hypothetical protein
MAEKKDDKREEAVAEKKAATKPPEKQSRRAERAPVRHPLDWAVKLGIHPDKLVVEGRRVKPASDLPPGVGPSSVAGASVANGWSRLRGRVHEPVPGVELTRKQFLAAVVDWMRSPSPEARVRLRSFQRRVQATKAAQRRKQEVNDG